MPWKRSPKIEDEFRLKYHILAENLKNSFFARFLPLFSKMSILGGFRGQKSSFFLRKSGQKSARKAWGMGVKSILKLRKSGLFGINFVGGVVPGWALNTHVSPGENMRNWGI